MKYKGNKKWIFYVRTYRPKSIRSPQGVAVPLNKQPLPIVLKKLRPPGNILLQTSPATLMSGGFHLFLIEIHSMRDWAATTRHGVTRKRSTKRLKHTIFIPWWIIKIIITTLIVNIHVFLQYFLCSYGAVA